MMLKDKGCQDRYKVRDRSDSETSVNYTRKVDFYLTKQTMKSIINQKFMADEI